MSPSGGNSHLNVTLEIITISITRSGGNSHLNVNSQGRGDNKLAIPEYTVYKYFIIPINIRLIVE